jgi:hypothetical protein
VDPDLWRGTVRARISGKLLFLDAPGNACGILPYHDVISSQEDEVCGYEFTSHNTDSSSQQLTLLAGLAALTVLATRNDVG